MAELDPVLAAVAAGSARGPSTFDGTVAEARARIAAAVSRGRDTSNNDRVQRISNSGAENGGHVVPVRISWPKKVPNPGIVVFAHGGGYALLSAELSDDICTRLSQELQSIVVAVDYRLAPEYPAPAAIDDVATVVRWVSREAERWGSSPDRIVLIGESAGANIAASVSILLADEVALEQQVLVVPGPDLVAVRECHDVAGSMLSVSDLLTIVDYYVGDDLDAAASFPASAAASSELHRSPTTLVALAGFDPTAPVGAAFAKNLKTHGVDVTVLEFPAMFHPFLGFAHVSDGAAQAFSAICDTVRARSTLGEKIR